MIIPETNSAEISEQLKIARGKLQLVPNKMFEELVMDLYDEVDRRECEASECQQQLIINLKNRILLILFANLAVWSTSTLNADHATVPFLPANPFLSATRNQVCITRKKPSANFSHYLIVTLTYTTGSSEAGTLQSC